ncbi:hypothetical protein ABW20_dc0101408 [Dactylellina cionopaga]|nr:hypothetical protein ABW20_dc0101408 [Dactylellina cionopaga]
MEFSTMEITWSVSVLTLLPLTYLTFLPTKVFYDPSGFHNNYFEASDSVKDWEKGTQPSTVPLFRLNTLAFCWVLSVYPFLSRMLETFGPSRIGDDADSIISTAEWTKIEELCLSGVPGINDMSRNVFLGFGIFGWIWSTLFTTAGLTMVYLYRQRPESGLIPKLESYLVLMPAQHGESTTRPIAMWVALAAITPVVAGVNIWSILALQKYQQDISETTGANGGIPEWGFGQIIAIIIYGPVCWELYRLGEIIYWTCR